MMAKPLRAFACLVMAVFLLTVFIPDFIYAQKQESVKQEESEQESPRVEKKVGEEIKPNEQEIADKGQSAGPKAEKAGPTSVEEVAEVIVPAPKNQKEAMGIYVFLAWIWLSIFVLIYILRLKVKEVDRIHQLKFFSKDEE